METKENLHDFSKLEHPSRFRPPLKTLSLSSITRHLPNNPQDVPEYSEEIISNLLSSQSLTAPSKSYMSIQPDLNHKIRAIAVDWLVSVHKRFKLLPETLFMSVTLLDRFLSIKQIPRTKLQLLAVSALWVASKYEEIYPPESKDLVNLTDGAYSKKELLVMEREMLSVLNYEITMPSAWRFYEKLSAGLKVECRNMGEYLLELSLVEYYMIRYEPALEAVAAVYLGQKIFKKVCGMPTVRLGYTEGEIKECAKDMLVMMQGAEKCSLEAVREKFGKGEFNEVSKIVLINTEKFR